MIQPVWSDSQAQSREKRAEVGSGRAGEDAGQNSLLLHGLQHARLPCPSPSLESSQFCLSTFPVPFPKFHFEVLFIRSQSFLPNTFILILRDASSCQEPIILVSQAMV